MKNTAYFLLLSALSNNIFCSYKNNPDIAIIRQMVAAKKKINLKENPTFKNDHNTSTLSTSSLQISPQITTKPISQNDNLNDNDTKVLTREIISIEDRLCYVLDQLKVATDKTIEHTLNDLVFYIDKTDLITILSNPDRLNKQTFKGSTIINTPGKNGMSPLQLLTKFICYAYTTTYRYQTLRSKFSLDEAIPNKEWCAYSCCERSYIDQINNYTKVLKVLTLANYDIRAESNNAAICFANTSDIQCLKICLNQGANIDTTDKMGISLLAHAVDQEARKIVDFLMSEGADVNKGIRTPLFCAINNENENMVKMLIDKKADVNQPKEKGLPLLSRAIVLKNMAISEMLVDAGADIDNPRYENDWTPLRVALDGNSIDILNMLKAKNNIKEKLATEKKQ